MFFWTQMGAMILIFAFQYIYILTNSTSFYVVESFVWSASDSRFLFWSFLLGFGVKFPIWPFYEWLPKAHVEASTNFSIFLSGVLVKFAFFAFFKSITLLGLDIGSIYVYPLILIGLIDSSLKIYYQVDLKKLVAYSTVIEMHWLLFAIISGPTFFWIAGFMIMISHALLSTSFFLLVDSITRRFKTRLIGEVMGLFYITPNLYMSSFAFIVIFLGFPGTLLFFSEILFFISLLDISFCFFLIIFFIAYLFAPSVFFKNWFLVLFGFGSHSLSLKPTLDLNSTELGLLVALFIMLFWLGLSAHFMF